MCVRVCVLGFVVWGRGRLKSLKNRIWKSSLKQAEDVGALAKKVTNKVCLLNKVEIKSW